MTEQPVLRVPVEFRTSIERLARMSTDEFDSLKEALHVRRDDVDRNAVCAGVVAATDWSVGDADRLVAMALSFLGTFGTAGLESIESLAESVVASPDLDDVADRAVAAQRLAGVLTSPVVALLSRAEGLLSEHAHLLVEARIVSDVRPIFERGTTDQLEAAMIGHTLRLNLLGAEPDSLYVALDRSDLEMLQRLIGRALKKDETLRQFVGKNNLPLVAPFAVSGVDDDE